VTAGGRGRGAIHARLDHSRQGHARGCGDSHAWRGQFARRGTVEKLREAFSIRRRTRGRLTEGAPSAAAPSAVLVSKRRRAPAEARGGGRVVRMAARAARGVGSRCRRLGRRERGEEGGSQRRWDIAHAESCMKPTAIYRGFPNASPPSSPSRRRQMSRGRESAAASVPPSRRRVASAPPRRSRSRSNSVQRVAKRCVVVGGGRWF
jgi:hypothetical protein